VAVEGGVVGGVAKGAGGLESEVSKARQELTAKDLGSAGMTGWGQSALMGMGTGMRYGIDAESTDARRLVV
jgi:hypothetical protein